MARKRIVILSDGTGNAAASVWRTNVWRLFELLHLSDQDQVAKYDDGVGSSSFKPMAILGGAFGWGLKRNVLDLYKFVCRNYEPDAQLFAFGFSRGAFTARVLVAFILNEGLVPYHSESDLDARAKAAYRAYRADRFKSYSRIEVLFRKIRDGLLALRGTPRYDRSANRPVPSFEFVGVWDTVAAYGLPIEEMTRGVSQFIWPLYLPERTLDPRVKRACHALSLDDERTTFHPVLWTEKDETPAQPDSEGRLWIKDERLSQVWFSGVHANVGGGYPDDSLAYVPLYWIMQEAAERGLVFKKPPKADPDAFLKVMSARDQDGRQYDPRSGLGGYYRYGPRKIAALASSKSAGVDAVEIQLPKVHESVLSRIRSDTNAYAPIGLPATYGVVTAGGEILTDKKNPFETPAEASARELEQERVWNLVWLRRIVYFLTLAASFHLVVFWWFHDHIVENEFKSNFRLVSEAIRLATSFLPRPVIRWWADWYATNPGWFLIGVLALVVLIRLGARLGAKITDNMRQIWKGRATQNTVRSRPLAWAIYRIRSSWPYMAGLGVAKRHILPLFAALGILWLGLTSLSHLMFNVVDSFGPFCAETPLADTVTLTKEVPASKPITFDTKSMCAPTGIILQRGVRYSVTVTIPDTAPWMDGYFLTHPGGFESFGDTAMPDFHDKARMFFMVPLRRVIFRRWFSLLGRIGATGNAEAFLDPRRIGKSNTFVGVIARADRSGELFLYVNEAVVPLPWVYDIFYRNNKGTVQVVVRRLN